MTNRRYDLFISLSGDDRAAVAPLRAALQAAGVRTFVDTENIELHTGISASIRAAIADSAAMLVYFSRSYTTRPACQQELITAFVAAHPAGQVAERILVVNQETDESHIEPVDLRDARFHAGGNRRDDRQWALAVADRLRRLSGTFGSLAREPAAQARGWFQRPVVEPPDLVDRYAEYWRIHSALHAGDYPLTSRTGGVPVAVVHGMTGIGKTTAVLRYGWLFQHAYPGGIVRLQGHDAVGYRTGMVEAARWLDVPTEGVPHGVLRQVLADHLGRRDERCLWIIDDVPAGLSPVEVESMIVPALNVHTVLSTPGGRYDSYGKAVPLDGLSAEQSRWLLGRVARLGPDRPEIDELARHLGGHPLSLTIAGASVRDGRGVHTVEQHRRNVAQRTKQLLAGVLDGLNPTAAGILRVAASLAPAPIPTDVIAQLLTGGSTEDRDGVVSALCTLEDWRLISRTETATSVHAMIAEAVRAAAVPDDRHTAHALAVSVRTRPRAPELVPHVRHVLARQLPRPLDIPLRTWLFEYEESAGDHVAAGGTGEILTHTVIGEEGPADAGARDVALRAARQLLEAGEYARAYALAEYVLEHRGALRAAATHVLARTLDGLGRFDDAWPHWVELRAGTDDDTVRMHYARALRLRGRHDEALRELTEVRDQESPWRLAELAVIYLDRSAVRQARQAADQAISGFRRRGLSEHPSSMEALGVMLDADLMQTAWTPLPFVNRQDEALDQMRRLVDRYTGQYGADNAMTLSSVVRYGIALAGWRGENPSREILSDAEHRARVTLGPQHPARLAALYGLSVAAMQAQRYADALDYAVRAHDGQVEVLGERHRDTLRTVVQLSAAWHCCGNPARARELLQGIPSELVRQRGLRDQEGIRALVVRQLSYVPPPLMRTFHRFAKNIGDRLT